MDCLRNSSASITLLPLKNIFTQTIFSTTTMFRQVFLDFKLISQESSPYSLILCSNIHHVIQEGDLIVMHGYGVTDPEKIEVLVVDQYRIKDGLLYEHWGAVQSLPPEQFGNPELM